MISSKPDDYTTWGGFSFLLFLSFQNIDSLKGGDHLLFHSSTSICSGMFKHLFTILHVRWLSRVLNRNACVYQTATRWDLILYWISIGLNDWWCNVCLLTWWFDSLQQFGTGNRWIWTNIVYHLCIISERTNHTCYSFPYGFVF